MTKNKSTIYPFKPCPKCGSTNLGFGSGRDILAFYTIGPDKALSYTYVICNNCHYEHYTWQKNIEDNDYYNRNIKEWNNMGKNKEKYKCLTFLKNLLKPFMKKII